MPICPRCQNGYENTEPHCPNCGAPRPVFLAPPPRASARPLRKHYSQSVITWLIIGRIVTLLAFIVICVLSLIDVVQSLVNFDSRKLLMSLFTLLGPILGLIPQYILFGIARDYAEQRNWENRREEQD